MLHAEKPVSYYFCILTSLISYLIMNYEGKNHSHGGFGGGCSFVEYLMNFWRCNSVPVVILVFLLGEFYCEVYNHTIIILKYIP